MEMDLVAQTIQTLGFPVACVIGMAWFVMYQAKNDRADKEKLYTELAENRTINKEFINTLQAVTNKIDNIQDDVNEIKSKIDK